MALFRPRLSTNVPTDAASDKMQNPKFWNYSFQSSPINAVKILNWNYKVGYKNC